MKDLKGMKIFKKNQIVIYVLALMLVVAGYLNYNTTNNLNSAIQTSSSEEELFANANIGDAQLVNANAVEGEVAENKDAESNNIVNEQNQVAKSENITMSNETQKEEENKKEKIDNKTAIQTSNNEKGDNYFLSSKMERESMYSQMLETYENVLNGYSTSEEQKQSAQSEIMKINNVKNSIMICENLIKTKGFKNCIVFVNDDSISCIVEDDELSQEEIAQIQNIISRELKAKAENIHISNKFEI